MNAQRFRQLSRRTPLNDSLCPFCHGLPGSMKYVSTGRFSIHSWMRFETNSGPLSLLMIAG